MTERNTMTRRAQPLDQLDPAIEFRRDGHDADVRRCALDLAKNIRCIELSSFSTPSTLSTASTLSTTSTLSTSAPQSGQRRTRTAEATFWLRAFVFHVDEIAFEVRRKHTRTARLRQPTRATNLFQYGA